MIALLASVALAVLTAALLWLAGVRGLLLGVAGIALFGGAVVFDRLHHVETGLVQTKTRPGVQSLAPLRHAFTGRFTGGERWLSMADSMASRGNTLDAAGILIAAVKQHPRDYSLWTGLGTMLTEHGKGLNPGAELAFQRAIALAPGYPTPRYFYGIAKLRSGDRDGALQEWTAVLAAAPADASWRGLIEDRIRDAQSAPRSGQAAK